MRILSKGISSISLIAISTAISLIPSPASADEMVITPYDHTVFYDGYQPEIIDINLADGILRHTNAHYAAPLSDNQIAAIGDNLHLQVIVDAMCDNYDRMGRISLALVPKGKISYEYAAVERIELARFITPFMNKNRQPSQVPYEYDLPEVGLILHNKALREKYDFWLEAEIFGIPYSAHTQVSGCQGHNDVFALTVNLKSSGNFSQTDLADNTLLYPVFYSQSEEKGEVNLNNHNAEATDELGKTVRTFIFNLDSDVTDSKLTFILTNHGAAENGEEYERRVHFVYFDDELKMTYTPGGVSCEPYRQYNTQGNYIYGSSPQDDWEEWNNWCPGQAVPVREINLGPLPAGEHSVRISVPDAVFYGGQGDFRPSIYVQALTEGTLPNVSIDKILAAPEGLKGKWETTDGIHRFIPTDDSIILSEARVYSPAGELLYGSHNPAAGIDTNGYSSPVIIMVITSTGEISYRKIL